MLEKESINKPDSYLGADISEFTVEHSNDPSVPK
jgi:hypothetical protein